MAAARPLPTLYDRTSKDVLVLSLRSIQTLGIKVPSAPRPEVTPAVPSAHAQWVRGHARLFVEGSAHGKWEWDIPYLDWGFQINCSNFSLT